MVWQYDADDDDEHDDDVSVSVVLPVLCDQETYDTLKLGIGQLLPALLPCCSSELSTVGKPGATAVRLQKPWSLELAISDTPERWPC